ncbi:MAG: YceI family protein [Actinomycetota bacterium]|jgi:polyisoprenoid-binding protein YceI|nr:YceI family protein [Actinomycetota bacterium]
MAHRPKPFGEPAVGLAAADTEPAPGCWDVDVGRSRVEVTIRHAVVSRVSATLSVASGTIESTEPDGIDGAAGSPRWQVRAAIDMGSVDSGDPNRDDHLRAENFLDVERFPVASFVSTAVTAVDHRRWRVPGDLTVRAVTRPVVLEARVEQLATVGGRQRATVVATVDLDRRQFDLSWNQMLDTGGLLLGPTLSVKLMIEACRRDGQAVSGCLME